MPNLFTRGIKSCAAQIKGCLPPRKGLHVGKLSRIVIIQDYEDQKKQYHNLEKDYVVQGSHPRFLILRPTLPKPLIATRAIIHKLLSCYRFESADGPQGGNTREISAFKKLQRSSSAGRDVAQFFCQPGLLQCSNRIPASGDAESL